MNSIEEGYEKDFRVIPFYMPWTLVYDDLEAGERIISAPGQATRKIKIPSLELLQMKSKRESKVKRCLKYIFCQNG